MNEDEDERDDGKEEEQTLRNTRVGSDEGRRYERGKVVADEEHLLWAAILAGAQGTNDRENV